MLEIGREEDLEKWISQYCTVASSWTGTGNHLQLPHLLDFNQPRACRIKFCTGRFSSLVKSLFLPSSPSLLYRANMAVGPLADITRGLCNTPHLHVFTGQEEGPANLHRYLQQKYLTQSTYITRVPQCLSPRPNWDPLEPKRGGHTRLEVRGFQFGLLKKKPSTSVFSVVS